MKQKVETVRGYLLPRDLHVTVTRDYGATAAQKSNELLWHMFLAIVSVSALIWLVLGRRESAVVLTAIPVTLALTLFVFYLYGYTLNRTTLFALIFSILYRRVMGPLIARPAARLGFLAIVAILLIGAVALVPLGLVTVKMLPFDNKSEVQVVVHMPEDTPLETTAGVASALADETLRDDAVTGVQSYAGTSSPYTFNGLVRHYFLRRAANLADLQVTLVNKDERREQSHAIAKRLRARLDPLATRLGARIQVVDPILQGLAISLMAGEVASLVLSRMSVPITYFLTHRRRPRAVKMDPQAAA